jgi:3-mercaptopyruvate sulfurtransferase SseA
MICTAEAPTAPSAGSESLDSQVRSGPRTIKAEEAGKMILELKAAYLDVRTPIEFASQGHVAGAVNVPWLLPGTDGKLKASHHLRTQDICFSVLLECRTSLQ